MSFEIQPPPTETPYKLEHYLPAHLQFLVKERPILWYENASEYDGFREWVFTDLKPRDVAEILQTKEFTDNYWEDRQLCRLKVAAIHDELPVVARDACEPWNDRDRDNRKKQEEVWNLASDAAVASDEEKGDEGMKAFNERALETGVTPDFIHYRAHNKVAVAIDRIDRRLAHLRERRDRIIRQMEDRRASLGAMARKLIDRDAEVIDFKEAK